jgi:hypothetical protein
LKPSLFREFASTVLAFVAVLFGAWVAYTILTGASHLNDILLFGRLLATGAPAARVNGALLVISEIETLLMLSLAFVYLRRNIRMVCIAIFFLMLLIRHCLLSPPAVFRDTTALGVFRWFGWLEPVFLFIPYVYLCLVAGAALIGFLPLRYRQQALRKRGPASSGVSAFYGFDSHAGAFTRVLSVAVIGTVLFQFAQKERFEIQKSRENQFDESAVGSAAGISTSEKPDAVNTTKGLSVYFVVQNLTLNALRNASVNFSAELNGRMDRADSIYAHIPDVLLSRPMRSELLGKSSLRHVGVRSNWDIQFVDKLQRDTNVISYRDEYAMHWIWLGEMLISAVDGIFKDMSRSGINPFFAQMRLDRGLNDVHSFEYSEFEAFRNVRTKINDIRSASSFADGRLFIELPPFPGGSISAQQLFLLRMQELFDVVLSRGGKLQLEQLVLVGLPPEELGRFEFGDKDQAAYLIARASGVALNWVLTDAQAGRQVAQSGDNPSLNFEERLRQIEDDSSVIQTECIRFLGIISAQAAGRVPDPCTDAFHKSDTAAGKGRLLHTEWSTDRRELLSRSELENFVRLTAPPLDETMQKRVHAVFSSWPGVYWSFQLGDEVLPNEPEIDVQSLRDVGFSINSLAGQWFVLGRD